MWIFALVIGSYSVTVTIGAIIIWVCYLKHLNITVRDLLRHNTRALPFWHMYQYEVFWKRTQGTPCCILLEGNFLQLIWEGLCLRVYELSFMHKGFSSSNLYSQALSSRSSGGKTIPSLTTPTPFPKQPDTTKEGFTYRHCITSMPKIDSGPTILQFNTAQQHFYLLLNVYVAKAACIIQLVQPQWFCLC